MTNLLRKYALNGPGGVRYLVIAAFPFLSSGYSHIFIIIDLIYFLMMVILILLMMTMVMMIMAEHYDDDVCSKDHEDDRDDDKDFDRDNSDSDNDNRPMQFGTEVKFRGSRDRNNRTAENAFSAPWFFF